ncbi:MAG: regulatory protein RecX [Nitrospiraceae bacterium]
MPPRKPTAQDGHAGDPIEREALRYLARRDRTETQVKTYLDRLGVSSTQARSLISRFRSLGYLNDEVYAVRWARTRLERRPMGRERLQAELIGQGIDPAMTARTLDMVYGEITERDIARKLLKGRGASPALLRRHGFSEETVEAFFGAEEGPS